MRRFLSLALPLMLMICKSSPNPVWTRSAEGLCLTREVRSGVGGRSQGVRSRGAGPRRHACPPDTTRALGG